jgi:hypothetical protein
MSPSGPAASPFAPADLLRSARRLLRHAMHPHDKALLVQGDLADVGVVVRRMLCAHDDGSHTLPRASKRTAERLSLAVRTAFPRGARRGQVCA